MCHLDLLFSLLHRYLLTILEMFPNTGSVQCQQTYNLSFLLRKNANLKTKTGLDRGKRARLTFLECRVATCMN